jgi:hypothetical protein
MSAEQVDAEPKQAKKVSVPPQERLLMATVELALIEASQDFTITDGPKVKGRDRGGDPVEVLRQGRREAPTQ